LAKIARRATARGIWLRPAASLAVELTPEQGIMILNQGDMD
jgi:hypothetical protein